MRFQLTYYSGGVSAKAWFQDAIGTGVKSTSLVSLYTYCLANLIGI